MIQGWTYGDNRESLGRRDKKPHHFPQGDHLRAATDILGEKRRADVRSLSCGGAQI